MRELTKVRWRTLGWFVLLPVPLAGLIPWSLHRRFEGPLAWQGTLGQWLGAWLIVDGLGLALWCVQLFNVRGLGTPVPLDPPKQLVAVGPYRFVRNPMLLGVFLVLIGQALLYRSLLLLAYALGLLLAAALFVRAVEEPGLRRRFGEGYRRYCEQVPRWIPRRPLRPCQGGPGPISGAPTPKAR